jgi:predicted transcriptional regulator
MTDAEREDRRRKVAHLMLAHATHAEMARTLGVSRQTISSDVRYIRAEWKAERVEAYDRYQAEEIKRLEALERALWQDALAGKWLAVDRVLAIISQRSRLLGTEAATKSVISVLTPELIEKAVAERQEKMQALMQTAQERGLSVAPPPVIDTTAVETAAEIEVPRG